MNECWLDGTIWQPLGCFFAHLYIASRKEFHPEVLIVRHVRDWLGGVYGLLPDFEKANALIEFSSGCQKPTTSGSGRSSWEVRHRKESPATWFGFSVPSENQWEIWFKGKSSLAPLRRLHQQQLDFRVFHANSRHRCLQLPRGCVMSHFGHSGFCFSFHHLVICNLQV